MSISLFTTYRPLLLMVLILSVSGCSFSAPWSGGMDIWPFGKGEVEAKTEPADRMGQGEMPQESEAFAAGEIDNNKTFYDELSRTTGAVIEQGERAMQDVPLEQPRALVLNREASEMPDAAQNGQDMSIEAQAQRTVNVAEVEMADIERDIALVSEELAALQPAYARIAELERKMTVLFSRLENLILEQNVLQQRQMSMQNTSTAGQASRAMAGQRDEVDNDLFQYESRGLALEADLDKRVVKMRHGQHSDKVRLVLEIEGSPEYKVDLNASENLLVIDLPQTSWNLEQSGAFARGTPVLESWFVQALDSEPGVRVIIALSSTARIKGEDLIPSQGALPSRLFIDLYAPSVHGS